MVSSIKHQVGSPHVYWHGHFQACPLTPNPNHKQGPTFSASRLWQSPQVQSVAVHTCCWGPSVSVPTRPRGAIPLTL